MYLVACFVSYMLFALKNVKQLKPLYLPNQINPFAKSGPSGQSIPAQVHQTADGAFKAEFVPRSVGEHRVNVTVKGMPTAGSPYAAKVLYGFFWKGRSKIFWVADHKKNILEN